VNRPPPTPATPTPELVPPGPGRRYRAEEQVKYGDVLPDGEVRLDALARYLQDIASDDGKDAAIDPHLVWVVRRTTLSLVRHPRAGEHLQLVTWASGSGGRWAERRTTITAAGEPVVEAASLWVCVDLATRRPAKLSERFWEMYGEAVGDRIVSPRLTHPDPPADALDQARPWPLRLADIDVLQHVNNAAIWAVVEDELWRRAPGAQISWAEMEYRSAIDADARLSVVSRADEDATRVWLLTDEGVQASAVASYSARKPNRDLLTSSE
jgi:acyl-ACP thioesterase